MRQRAEIAAPPDAPPVWAVATLIHFASFLASLMLAMRVPELLPGAAWCGLAGAGAAVLGVITGLPWWWLPINLLFVPVAHALLSWQIPSALYLAGFCIVFALNTAVWCDRVPLFLSSSKVTLLLSRLLPQHAGFQFLDIGCGTGSLLAGLAQLRPDGRYHGIETAPLSYVLSRLRTRLRDAVHVTWGDFWNADLAHYDVVYAYLSPAPMTRLWNKARREMRPGSILVSNTFCVPGVAPDYVLPAGDRMRSTLFVWQM
jgi:hypothetical protein